MRERVWHVLFLCTGNSARSIMAEVMLRHLGSGRFIASSAGSHPKGTVHPLALATLQSMGLPVDGLRSKSWEECARSEGPPSIPAVGARYGATPEPFHPGRRR
jgi:arsenate reductase (thioredoxin)